MSSAATRFEFVSAMSVVGCSLVSSLRHTRPRQETMPGPLAAPPTVQCGPLCLGQGVRPPAGCPAPGRRARRPPSPRGAPGPARPAAARLPPPPRRAPRRALGAPGQRVLLDKQSKAIHGETSLRLGELHHRMPHAATRRACAAVSLMVCCIQSLQNQARALQQSAAHARQAARLLGELRALARQRRGKALLGCCLHLIERLGACEEHLGTLPRSAEHAYMSEISACIHARAIFMFTVIQPVSRMNELVVGMVPVPSRRHLRHSGAQRDLSADQAVTQTFAKLYWCHTLHTHKLSRTG